ncbi:NAD(P)/FAD-dependent oxidoreductase [Thalassoroseus pseudoceratinae]|uniref:NAD(P)/FAD-dependent oxidoreductase n=1 Tax=Thalassoroseus pseudoceratinae TaxID=2713176 RepID=UPI00142302CA|nr:FAD-binding oxidoreductase [Thalassoroseus pseudoceratinae]
MPTVDDIIIGQGLAGSVLSWQLHWQGRQVLVIDRADTQTASRVAAGLVTPVTGMRFVRTWRFDEFWSAATEFYRRVEQETGAAIFRIQPSVRIFATETERENYAKRLDAGRLTGDTRPPNPSLNSRDFQVPFGAFEMPSAARLDVARFLELTRNRLERTGHYWKTEIDSQSDIQPTSQAVRLPRLDLTAERLFFCEGIAAMRNPWFAELPFDPAAGEILTVRIPGLTESRTIHRGLWLTGEHSQQHVFRVGATYDREDLHGRRTSSGRDTILKQLRDFVPHAAEVLQHDAAVRPIVVGRNPVIGQHSEHPQLWLFNGLASKGALQAPAVGAHLVAAACEGLPIDPEYDFHNRRKFQ